MKTVKVSLCFSSYQLFGREMETGGLVGSAPACYGNSLGSNPDISQKYKMNDISKGEHTLSGPPKNTVYKKKLFGMKISKISNPFFKLTKI
jgi:hypothetical protein